MDEKELQEMLIRIRQYQVQAEALAQQVAIAQSAISEHDTAISTIKSLKDTEKDSELLVPIGAGSYIHAKFNSVERIIVELGSGVSAERDSDGAVDILEGRKEDLGKSYTEANGRLAKLEQEIQRLQSIVQSAVNQAQQQAAFK